MCVTKNRTAQIDGELTSNLKGNNNLYSKLSNEASRGILSTKSLKIYIASLLKKKTSYCNQLQ